MFLTPTTRKTTAPTSKRDRTDTHKAMVPRWATEGAADMPSPSCGAVSYLCGYVLL